jgi:hypothetical protein
MATPLGKRAGLAGGGCGRHDLDRPLPAVGPVVGKASLQTYRPLPAAGANERPSAGGAVYVSRRSRKGGTGALL